MFNVPVNVVIVNETNLIHFFPVPGRPMNVLIGEVNDSSIALTWSEPLHPNGVIKGYRIYFMRKNFTDVQTVRGTEPVQKFVLTELGKNSQRFTTIW